MWQLSPERSCVTCRLGIAKLGDQASSPASHPDTHTDHAVLVIASAVRIVYVILDRHRLDQCMSAVTTGTRTRQWPPATPDPRRRLLLLLSQRNSRIKGMPRVSRVRWRVRGSNPGLRTRPGRWGGALDASSGSSTRAGSCHPQHTWCTGPLWYC